MTSYEHRQRMVFTVYLLVFLYALLILRRVRRPPIRHGPAYSLVDTLLQGEKARADIMAKPTKRSDRSSIDKIRVSIHVFE